MSDEKTAAEGIEALDLVDFILTGGRRTITQPGPEFSPPYPPSDNPGQILPFQKDPAADTLRDTITEHTSTEDQHDKITE
jgi:hypothetical protein